MDRPKSGDGQTLGSGDGQTLGDGQTSGESQTLGDSQTLEDSQTSRETARPWKTARPRRKWAPHQNRGGNPEIQKVGGIPKNSGETLKNWRDREIGGSAKNRSGVTGAVEDHRRLRNLDDEEPG